MDIQYLLWLQEFRNATGGVFDAFFEVISELMHGTFAYLLAAAIYWCIDKNTGVLLAMNVGFGSVVNQTFKNTFCIYRPWIRDASIVPVGDSMESATGYSFPSGHTQLATAEFGTIAIWQRRRKWVVGLCTVMIAAVMFSRNYLGVHTPQDVLVSCALCCVVIYGNYHLKRWIEAGRNRDLMTLGVGLIVCAAFLAFVTCKSYPIDYAPDGSILVDPEMMITDCYVAAGCAIGFLIGWILERRFVQFEPMPKVWQKILSFIVGAALLAAVIKGICEPLYYFMLGLGTMAGYWGKLLYSVIAFIFIVTGYPCIIKLADKLMNHSERYR